MILDYTNHIAVSANVHLKATCVSLHAHSLTRRLPAQPQMLQSVSPPLLNEEVIEIEQFRARHRRLLRTRQQQIPATIESLDEDDGRRRKISSKWRQKQKKSQQNDNWSQPVSSFNAFDFSTSPETFCDVVEAPCAAFQDEQRMAEAARQVASMGFHCTNMWQGMDDWVPNTKPTYYSTCSDQRRTLYQPQNYA